MPKVRVRCNYCGRDWDEYVYTDTDVSSLRCRCGNTKLTVKPEKSDDRDPFGYNYVPKSPKPGK